MRMRALAMTMAAVGAAAVVPVVTTQQAHAAATCASFSTHSLGPKVRMNVPSTGHQNFVENCVLGVGNQGPGVFVLQDALRRCYGQGIVWDAIYGGATRDAVRNVQRFHGITDDGTYGPQTHKAMVFPKYDTKGNYLRCW
jgi:peptidoglycan hydrolase-like protein with peptidoglycan-binding domain